MKNRKSRISAIITVTVGLSASLGPVRADPIIYATAAVGSQLVRIDVGTQQVATVGDLGVFGLGIAISPQGRMFTATDSAGGCPPACNPQLARVNHATGRAIPFGDLHGEQFMALGFSSDGTLYGVNALSDGGSLYRFDIATGEATRVGATGVGQVIMDLAWHDGTMFGVSPDSLYRIDLATGAATLVKIITGLSANRIMGLAIDDDGNFYVSEIIPNSPLYLVDPNTGVATKILDTGVDFIHSLEFTAAPRSRVH